MCGRARCTLRTDQIAAACGIAGDDGNASSIQTLHMDRFRPSYNVSPGAYMPVVRRQKGGEGSGEGKAAPLVIHCMKWGLVPSFTKKTEKPDHYRMFNARSESIREKASFRRLIPNNCCLVAVEGFYEWKKDGSKKQPYYIHFKDHRPLVFAALYDSWESSEGEILHTFTILTTCSSTNLQWLHDRMPVILGSKGSTDAWLDNSVPKLETLLVPYEDDNLVWYPVTPAMGKPSFGGPECIKEVQLKSTGENLISKFFTKKATDKSQPEPQQQTLHEKSLQTDAFDGVKKESGIEDTGDNEVKKEPASEATEHLSWEEDNGRPDHSTMVKEENKGPEKCGIKREYEESVTESVVTAETVSSIPSSPLKKKERSVKNTQDKQTSLLSYFGKT